MRTQIVLGIFDKETQKRLLRDDALFSKAVLYSQLVQRAKTNTRMLTSVDEAEKNSTWS